MKELRKPNIEKREKLECYYSSYYYEKAAMEQMANEESVKTSTSMWVNYLTTNPSSALNGFQTAGTIVRGSH